MEVFITGGSGFVGSALCAGLLADGHRVRVLSRSYRASTRLAQGAEAVIGNPNRPGPWQEAAATADAAVNLAGASIFGRWTKQYKQMILHSRVNTTRNLVDALARGGKKPVLVSASAVGFYGFHGDEELDETDPPGEDFLARVCRAWEDEAMRAESFGARVARARFGIVLGRRGGALGQMLPLFRKGLGGRLGNGRQWLSWVHQADLAAAVLFLLRQPDAAGAYNLTAPEPVTNRDFTRTLAKVLHRPALLPAPGLAVRLVLGEFGNVLLKGQRVLPARLRQAGFSFAFPTVDQALRDLLAPAEAAA